MAVNVNVGPSGAGAGNNPSQNTLYVGDLHQEVQESMIYSRFSAVAQVSSIRVCRDMITRRSLGYAYVNFNNHADAEKALEALNFQEIRGRPMRIMWSQRDPSIRKSGLGNVFIKNLNKTIPPRDLYDTLCCFGKILSLKIARDDKGNSRGFGFVHFEKEEDAKKAITKMNGMLVHNKKVFVGHFVRKQDRGGGAGGPTYNNVFVKNFGEDMTDEKLKEMFAPFGELGSVKVMLGNDGKSRGFGFVCFKTCEDAAKAVDAMNGKELSSSNGSTSGTNQQQLKIFCGPAQKKGEREELLKSKRETVQTERKNLYANTGVNLYVKNLHESVDDEALQNAFAEYGQITSAKVMKDESGRSKGFGFVCFQTPEDAAKAVTEKHSSMMNSKPLYVALAQRKDERRQQLAQAYTGHFMSGRGMPAGMMPHQVPRPGMPGIPGMGGAAQQQMLYHPQQPGAAAAYGNKLMNLRMNSAAAAAQSAQMYQQMQAAYQQQQQQAQQAGKMPGAAQAAAGFPPQAQAGLPGGAGASYPGAAGAGGAAAPFPGYLANPNLQNFRQIYSGNAMQMQRMPMNMQQQVAAQQQQAALLQQQQQSQAAAQQQLPVQQQLAGGGAVAVAGSSQLSGEEFRRRYEELTDPQAKKELIGEQLFYKAQQKGLPQPGKITGMLLEIKEIVELVAQDSPQLYTHMEEAVRVLTSRAQAAAAAAAGQASAEQAQDPGNAATGVAQQ